MLVAVTIGSVLAWAAWAVLIYLLGTKVMPERGTRADLGEVLRTLGFAAARCAPSRCSATPAGSCCR